MCNSSDGIPGNQNIPDIIDLTRSVVLFWSHTAGARVWSVGVRPPVHKGILRSNSDGDRREERNCRVGSFPKPGRLMGRLPKPYCRRTQWL